LLEKEDLDQRAEQLLPVVMGPGLRRDDEDDFPSIQISKGAFTYDFAFSRRIAPEACWNSSPSKSEGAGNAGCALHPRSRVRFAQN
jgi:hypothetical protein